MKQKILVDMDGVLANVYKSLIEMQYTEKGIMMSEKQLCGIEERTAFPDLIEIVNRPGFFRNALVMNDAVMGLQYLNDKYNVRIVSSATEFPNSMNEKQQWLAQYFPFIHWKQLVFCGEKDGITGDLMLDDHPKNLSHFEGKRYLFTQPHNTKDRKSVV